MPNGTSNTDTRITIMDGNEAAASVAYRSSEVIAIYPITPSSPMGELSDEWSAKGKANVWGAVPQVIEMQSEGGAAGAVHGALQAGALSTTFTASQGLLLMIPNMYKIAGELTPCVLHVAARTLATHALSIFGDHSDVMACRQTGFAMLASANVQEAHDMALVAHAATLRARVPFLHFFDGFRTSHEVNRVETLSDDDLRALLDERAVAAHRRHGLSPDHPVVRGTAQNPDVFFQAREAANPYYEACPAIVQEMMDRLAARTGRAYRLYDYAGHPQAERVVIAMGSGAETAAETVRHLAAVGERVGCLTVRLFRPFAIADFVTALPETVRRIAVLDRTKEPGAVADPLYLDVVAALAEARAAGSVTADPVVVGGRYGLSSKEFTPAMVKAVFDELARERPKRRFTVGITDDVLHSSIPWDPSFEIENAEVSRAVFFGLGSDGTVGANKNSIKIIEQRTGGHAQAYFVYDSRKSGSSTVSHLRFSPHPIRAPYLIGQAQFVACHHVPLLERMEVVEMAAFGATVLLNAPGEPEAVWASLPREVQRACIDKRVALYTVDASAVARETGLGRRINTIMQTCFFALAKVMPEEDAIADIKAAIQKTYGRRSEETVRRNFAAVDQALTHLKRIPLPDQVTAVHDRLAAVPDSAPDFVRRVTAMIIAGHGDKLPVSAFPVDGTWPTGTAKFERRNIASEVPGWNAELCIQCNKCTLVCPHAVIRAKAVPEDALADAPAGFTTLAYRGNEFPGARYTLQVSPADCTGCGLCVEVCPAKDKANPKRKALEMRPVEAMAAEQPAFDYFLTLPEAPREKVPVTVKHTQLLQPLFEFSGACAGCGETPYLKLLSQLFGDRAVIANATGCSSIYGGNLPTTPYAANADGRGPAWANSLFEDNAEFGLGIRVAIDQMTEHARDLLAQLSAQLEPGLVTELLEADQAGEAGIAAQRARVALLKERLAALKDPLASRLADFADYLVRKSVWIVGGDGWAYDIGYGGLDHVLASDRDINVLVMDTEVYSNTGGQQSKATPIGASAKFAMAGRKVAKKDLGMIAMAYEHVYVARTAFGAKDAQTLHAFTEAESYRGPSLILAYSPCIAHGYDLVNGLKQQKLAMETGHWPLYRHDPRRLAMGEPPLVLDSPAPTTPLSAFMAGEARFKVVERDNPERYRDLVKAAEANVRLKYDLYRHMAGFAEAPAGADADVREKH
ncbi:pyruvate:ferredoxin (flavodoxin) oxidoreductase [Azospirillum canadense]|uniref:pyruvate:ferredoxin (flavodoxin) oxidoreductase n=1 Tax=Azospirillum canadense TaxID=403962 RepID=UPI002226C26C|nr:pyruvate:ferredoxin (flavodoxin) oxidoreductase [Azospirillum canadense]MCW2239754.1 pyruvate-ferredoxin/flavodoxin oxidoreductase [Azospirillum canadense]